MDPLAMPVDHVPQEPVAGVPVKSPKMPVAGGWWLVAGTGTHH